MSIFCPLWASLGRRQAKQYGRGRWLLAGDAAHAMGPSLGAGMMVGVLGAWRLGTYLSNVGVDNSQANDLILRYEKEQRSQVEQVQRENGFIFANMAVTNRAIAVPRALLLRLIGNIRFISQRQTETEALLHQRLPECM